ncbi:MULTISPECIES: hypothetical protein [Bacillus amyloliquefaciens group]|uniref:hypothetical protein n=1 Tax=Bacillus amyloliquefaciens group TaxID=1938374 RepID=UPI00214F9E1A|nr:MULTISPECIES: hypothetical protein [Bacillus amyloliquefaciens group]MCR4367801.1 hypothetical protein [Bacillus amyloliquefaciens]MCV3202483.1 hypothetical protein [Bacillus velezensis]
MRNGEFVLGKVFPIFETLHKDGEIFQTFIAGYEIEYSTMSLKDDDKPDFKVDGRIPFPVSMLGKTYKETVKNVTAMLNANKQQYAYEVFGMEI